MGDFLPAEKGRLAPALCTSGVLAGLVAGDQPSPAPS